MLVVMCYLLGGPLQPHWRQKYWHTLEDWWSPKKALITLTPNLSMHLEGLALKSWDSLGVPACSSPEDKLSFKKDITKGTERWLRRNIQCLLAAGACGSESISPMRKDLELVGLSFHFADQVPQWENPVHISYGKGCCRTFWNLPSILNLIANKYALMVKAGFRDREKGSSLSGHTGLFSWAPGQTW